MRFDAVETGGRIKEGRKKRRTKTFKQGAWPESIRIS